MTKQINLDKSMEFSGTEHFEASKNPNLYPSYAATEFFCKFCNRVLLLN